MVAISASVNDTSTIQKRVKIAGPIQKPSVFMASHPFPWNGWFDAGKAPAQRDHGACDPPRIW